MTSMPLGWQVERSEDAYIYNLNKISSELSEVELSNDESSFWWLQLFVCSPKKTSGEEFQVDSNVETGFKTT